MGLKVPVTVNLSALADGMRTHDTRSWTLCGSLCTVNDVLVREFELESLEMGDVLAFAKEDPVTGCIQKIVVATIDGKKLRPNEWYGADLEKRTVK